MLIRRQVPGMALQRLPVSPLHQHAAPVVNDKLGRFDKEFVEINQIGSGEFSKVFKILSKNGPSNSLSRSKDPDIGTYFSL